MTNRTLAQVAGALMIMATACGRSALMSPDAEALPLGSGGIIGSGGTLASGGAIGAGGSAAGGGGGGTVIVRLPDGGLPTLLGDSGVLNGILDAPRDSFLGQVICGPEVRLGAPCSASEIGCVLPSLGGACACLNGNYLCPLDTKAGPLPCPSGAKTGARCLSPLSTCVGGGANACVCGAGTYTCF